MKRVILAFLFGLGIFAAGCDMDRDDNVIERGGESLEEGVNDAKRGVEDTTD